MKRSWIGFALLVILLAAALVSSWAMEEFHEAAANKLEQAGQYALAGNWAGAAFLTADVQRDWDRWELLRCALADHSPMEEIETLFSALEVYGTAREKVAFAALCREAAQKMEAMGQAHGLQLHNLL